MAQRISDTRRKGSAAPRRKAVAAQRKPAAAPPRPIDLYYWPTPNGWKVSIMLEECGLPYRMIPVNIAKGEQFEPAFLKISPNNRMPAIVDPDGPGGRPISVFESGAILQYLGPQDRPVLSGGRARPRRGRPVAVLADGQPRAQGRRGEPLPDLCGRRTTALRHRAVRQRTAPAVRRHECSA